MPAKYKSDTSDYERNYRDIRRYKLFVALKAVSLTSSIVQLFFLGRGLSLAELGPASGLASTVPYLLSLPLAGLADRNGKANILVSGAIAQTAAFAAALFLKSTAGVFVYYLFFSLALTIFMLATRPLAAELLKRQGRPELIGELISSSTALSIRISAVTGIVGSLLAGALGMDAVFLASLLISALAGLTAAALAKDSRPPKTAQTKKSDTGSGQKEKPPPGSTKKSSTTQAAGPGGLRAALKAMDPDAAKALRRAFLLDILMGGELSIFICFFAQPMLAAGGLNLGLFGAAFFVIGWIQSFGCRHSQRAGRHLNFFARRDRSLVFGALLALAFSAALRQTQTAPLLLLVFFFVVAFVEGITGVVYDSRIQSLVPVRAASSVNALRILLSGACVFAVQSLVGLLSAYLPLNVLLVGLLALMLTASILIPDPPPKTAAAKPKNPPRIRHPLRLRMGQDPDWVYDSGGLPIAYAITLEERGRPDSPLLPLTDRPEEKEDAESDQTPACLQGGKEKGIIRNFFM